MECAKREKKAHKNENNSPFCVYAVIELSRNNVCIHAKKPHSKRLTIHSTRLFSYMHHHLLFDWAHWMSVCVLRNLCFSGGFARLFSWEFHMNSHLKRTQTWMRIHNQDKEEPKLQNETSVENYLKNIQLGLLRQKEEKSETIVKMNIHLFSSILSGFIRLRLYDSALICKKKEWVVQLEIRLYFAHLHCSRSKRNSWRRSGWK